MGRDKINCLNIFLAIIR